MSTVPESLSQPVGAFSPEIPSTPASAERQITELHALLRELEAVTRASHTLPPVFDEAVDDRLVQIRLGAAAGLFAALQCKNAAIAGHAFRVALSCSAWAADLGLPESERDAIEVAALLHDIGMIGVPDHILLKSGPLDSHEEAVTARARAMSLEIIRHGCTSAQTLEIVEHMSAWYDGSREGFSLHRQQIPLGARMVAIAEAFHAMIIDHVYRPARSQEQAIAELYACSGTQFDPELVRHYDNFCQRDQTAARWEVAHRWLRPLDSETVDTRWASGSIPLTTGAPAVDALFQSRLLDSMYDAVAFIDAAGRIALWNHGAERLTGINGVSVCHQMWHPKLLGLSDEKGQTISATDCPVHTAIRCGAQSLRRLTIYGRGQRSVAVDSHTMPVIDEMGVTQGAILLLHDASSETSLERRCQSLHEKSTKDSMTQVANRAEFDRVHAMFVATHQQQKVSCSLIMGDLDRFKLVNDTYGHQAGDDAIKSLTSLLKSSCRPGDLVARYGGEEFVILCADCDNASAARRAEQTRKALSRIAQPKMEGRAVTVSFGVTEIQPGDTPETMLRRADRALLMAKANGRNTVVQLGIGAGDESMDTPSGRQSSSHKDILERDLLTPVPVNIAIEKLRGFVADHQAKIIAIDGNQVRLEINDKPAGRLRRMADRHIAFLVDLQFEEEHVERESGQNEPSFGSGTTRTKIKITVKPRKKRDRRQNDVTLQAREVLTSFRSYLMAVEEDLGPSKDPLTRMKRFILPWLVRK